jgi:hypothetical protein
MTSSDREPGDDELDTVLQISLLLAEIPEQLEAYRAIEPVQPGARSAVAADDFILTPFPASQIVGTCLAAAADCLSAIDVLMHDGEDPFVWVFAQYPLLRSALEASSQVLWLLGPESRRARVVRNLRVRATESKQDELLFAPAFADSSTELSVQLAAATVQTSELARIAEREGIPRNDYLKKQLSYSEIVRAGSIAVGGDGARDETVWRLISGFAHPYTSRSRAFSTLHPLGSGGDSTGVSAMMPNPMIVLLALNTALNAFRAAVELTKTRMS